MEETLKAINAHHVVELLSEKLENWFEIAVTMLPNFVIAVLVLTAFAMIARFSKGLILKLAQSFSSNTSLNRLTVTIVNVIIVGMGLFLALNILHLDKTVASILAGVGVIGLALGFAFQETAANFMSGIFLAIKRPFKVDDVIEVQNQKGIVYRISLRTTEINTFQGQRVIIPNKDLFQGIITNYSTLGIRRVDLSVGVSYGSDLQKVEDLTVKAIEDLDLIFKDEPVQFFYNGFGGSSIDYSIRFWVEYPDEPGFLRAKSEAIKTIKKLYDENNINIPFPIRTLDFGIKGGKPLSKEIEVLEPLFHQ